jgi:hypothetical protein
VGFHFTLRISITLITVQFVYVTAGIYLLVLVVTMFYAFKETKISNWSHNFKDIVVYTFFIILSGKAATLLLDIDKIMLNQYIKTKHYVLFY